jgi:F0F1-type ATP synthase membrane subunit b/b'
MGCLLLDVLGLANVISEATDSWWNYPGLELWKFVNLLVFIVAGIYLHKRFGSPVYEGLRARRDAIKRELRQAKQERDQTAAKMAEVESRFQRLDAEIARIRERVEAEAEAERIRIETVTAKELSKLREQAERELASAAGAVRHELRRLTAEQSVRLAEELVAREIQPEDELRLVSLNAEVLGRKRL